MTNHRQLRLPRTNLGVYIWRLLSMSSCQFAYVIAYVRPRRLELMLPRVQVQQQQQGAAALAALRQRNWILVLYPQDFSQIVRFSNRTISCDCSLTMACLQVMFFFFGLGSSLPVIVNATPNSPCFASVQGSMSHDMTKPTKWVCAQWRLRSAWASAQSDQSLRYQHEESLGS